MFRVIVDVCTPSQLTAALYAQRNPGERQRDRRQRDDQERGDEPRHDRFETAVKDGTPDQACDILRRCLMAFGDGAGGAAIAWPDETPGAGLAMILAAGKMLKRSTASGPTMRW